MEQKSHGLVKGWILIGVLLIAIIASGYGIFVFFLKGFNPTTGTLSLLLFAVIAGTATFFSPCSFPLMPGYLARHLQLINKSPSKNVLASTLSNGLAAAAGVLLFDLALGLAIVLLGSTFGGSFAISTPSPNPYVRIFRGTVGVFLALLGVLSLRGTRIFHNDTLTSLEKWLGPGEIGTTRQMFVYGFGYVSVGIGCAGPILSGLLLFALSFGGTIEAAGAFLLFATTMAGLMIGVSLLVSVSPSTLTRLTHTGPQIKKTAAIAQIAVGIFLVLASYYNSWFVQLLFPT